MGVFLICRTMLNNKYLLINQIQYKSIRFLILKLRSKLLKNYKNAYCFSLNLLLKIKISMITIINVKILYLLE